MFSYWVMGEDGEARPATHDEWALWIEKRERQIRRDQVGDALVSTVLLGLEIMGTGRAWETMILGGPANGWQQRARTRAEAEAMHDEALAFAHKRNTRYWKRRAEWYCARRNRKPKRWKRGRRR